jgi:hypothetical protein
MRCRRDMLIKGTSAGSDIRHAVMTPETYYTIRSIHSRCGTGAPALFDLTYRRVWRPELGDDRQRCDPLGEPKEIEPRIPFSATS